jgi:TPR repeat protein
VEKNCGQAIKWIRLSVRQGSPLGEDNLGSMYEEGCGVKKDTEEALKWFKRSAEHGCADGKRDLLRLTQALSTKK